MSDELMQDHAMDNSGSFFAMGKCATCKAGVLIASSDPWDDTADKCWRCLADENRQLLEVVAEMACFDLGSTGKALRRMSALKKRAMKFFTTTH